jgi:hypothetical protein
MEPSFVLKVLSFAKIPSELILFVSSLLLVFYHIFGIDLPKFAIIISTAYVFINGTGFSIISYSHKILKGIECPECGGHMVIIQRKCENCGVILSKP